MTTLPDIDLGAEARLEMIYEGSREQIAEIRRTPVPNHCRGHFGLAAHDYKRSTGPGRGFADFVLQRPRQSRPRQAPGAVFRS